MADRGRIPLTRGRSTVIRNRLFISMRQPHMTCNECSIHALVGETLHDDADLAAPYHH